MEFKKEDKLVMCAPCCSNCPEAFLDGETVVITDDNDSATEGVRKVKLTKEQFKMLLEQGRKIISQ